MSWQNVRLIFQREVRDQLRDRRTLFMIFVLPILLYPLLGMSMFQMAQFLREEPTTVIVVGADHLPSDPALLAGGSFARDLFATESESHLLKVRRLDPSENAKGSINSSKRLLDEAQRMLNAGECDAVLSIPPGLRAGILELRLVGHATREDSLTVDPEKESKAPLEGPEVLFNSASEKSQITNQRVNSVLRRWTQSVVKTTLVARGIPADVAKPFQLSESDIAPPAHRDAAMWSKVLPFLLILWALTGAFYPAVDLCAGEKERGTLETLLSGPAERTEIVWGKLATVTLFSMATAALNLVSIGVTGFLVVSQLPKFGPPPPLAPVWLMVALVPMAALFSAVCLALASFARSTKEGQYYLVPVVLVTMPLVMLPMAPTVELTLGNSLIPVTGVVLLLRALLEGNYWQALLYTPPVAAVTLACCLLAIRWAVDQFNSESVLFRESERWDLGLWFKQLFREREATPTATAAVFCGVLILLVRFFMSFAMPQPRTFMDIATLAVVTQLSVILTPALLMTIMVARSPRATLALRRVPVPALVAAVLLAAMLQPLANWLNLLVLRLYPISDSVAQAFANLAGTDHPLWISLLVLAVLPAVCEELAFRGFILSGLRRIGHKWQAIVISSVFFGLTHAVMQQSIVATILGMVLGFVAVQTGSVFPCILFHMTHNALGVLMTRLSQVDLETHTILGWMLQSDPTYGFRYTWPAVVLGTCMAAAIMGWYHRLPYRKTAEEVLQDAIRREASSAAAS